MKIFKQALIFPILILLLFNFSALQAQNCGSNSYTLTNQSDIDNFQANNGSFCDMIVNSLRIEDDNNGVDDITNLDGLSDLISVGANLIIDGNDNLTDIDGLANITSVGTDLQVLNNPLLTNLNGLIGITSVTVNVQIEDNALLTDLTGLQNLNTIGNDLRVERNASLTNLNGLSGFTSLGEDLIVLDNDNLIDIDALSNVTTVTQNLRIEENAILSNINALSNVNSIGNNLRVTDNAQLAECCGVFPILIAGVGGAVTMNNNLVAGNCNNDGADVTMACPAVAAVPTMGEWGLLILALLILSIGTLYSIQPSLQTANGQYSISAKSDFRNWNIPFQKSLFQKIWLGTIVSLTAIFAVSIFFFGYELTNADVPMGILASGIFAFLGQLMVLDKEKAEM